MKKQILPDILLLLLAIIFSVGLMFAFIELPRILDTITQSVISTPHFDQGADEMSRFRSDLFISASGLRFIGYSCFLIIISLIVTGFLTKKSSLAFAGAFVLFLPVFGQFALSMFFLAGLGLLRAIWLPFMDISFDVLSLGDVIYLPYKALLWFFGLFSWDAHEFLTYFFMISGAFMFTWGVLTWMRARFGRNGVATGWLYRISRHPQYLGWIIWSYGMVLFAADINPMKRSWSVPASLPWLLATMIIIGICLMEELRMKEEYGDKYEAYRKKTPFLFPLPSWFRKAILAPARLLTGRWWPDSKRGVVAFTSIYTVILLLLYLPMAISPVNKKTMDTTAEVIETKSYIDSMVTVINNSSRRDLNGHFKALEKLKEDAVPVLIDMAGSDRSEIREYAVISLSTWGDTSVSNLLYRLLHDENWRVVSEAINALAVIERDRCIDSLIVILEDPAKRYQSYIYRAFGKIGSEVAWDWLVQGLEDANWWERTAAIDGLTGINLERSLPHLGRALMDEDPNVRRKAVDIFLLKNPPGSAEYLVKVIDDEDFETRFYARQALKLITDR